MNLSHLFAAAALMATLTLAGLLLNLPPLPFGDPVVIAGVVMAQGASWAFTLGAMVVMVYSGGLGWQYWGAVPLHVMGGLACSIGIFLGLTGNTEGWEYPVASLAVAVALVMQAGMLGASGRSALRIGMVAQVAFIVLVPAGYYVRTVIKERAHAAYNVNWNEELHERSNHIPSNAPIEQYYPFVVEPRHQGIAEHAARLLARREDHEAMLIAALQGPKRFEALRLLAVEGIPPTAALASAAKNAIAALPAEERESKIVREVTKRFSLVQA